MEQETMVGLIVVLSIGAMALALALSWWMGHCNNKASDQRLEILDHCWSKGTEDRLYKSYQKVSYEKHFWYLLTLRDPMKLYEADDEEATGKAKEVQ